jgi:hypothetical protein
MPLTGELHEFEPDIEAHEKATLEGDFRSVLASGFELPKV